MFKVKTNLLPILSGLVLMSCSAQGSVGMQPRGFHAASMHASAGSAYQDSFKAALMGPVLCRDLTDEEMDEADDLPGGGYSDGKWSGENPPENEDEDGNPTYAAQQVFEDADGTIIILEDDGDVTYLSCQWPDEYPGSDEPGAAYKESQAAAEDADCHED